VSVSKRQFVEAGLQTRERTAARTLRIGYVMQEGVEIRRPPFNGPANHVREVVQGLVRRGHQVRVVVRVGGRIWRSDDLNEFVPVTAPSLDRGPLRLIERGTRRIQSALQLPYAAMWESLRFADACVQELRGFDLVYERIGWVAYGAGLAARRLDVPLVLEDNGDQLFDLEAKGIAPQGVQRTLSVSLMRAAVRRAAHVVSSGAGWREQFITRWGYDPARVTTIENGTVLLDELRREQLPAFAPDAAAATGPATLVYVGGFYPWHGVPVLFEALAAARARGAQARLLMIGSGDGFESARELAASLGLGGDVTFIGHLKPQEYAPLLAAADIGVSPYCGWPEFSGLKVLDYKAAGLPTIASGVNGHPPTLKHGHTGLIVPPGNVEALRDAILELSGNARLRRCMGRAARLEAESMHAWEHTVERLEQVFLAAHAARVH
jgi:glycosyltransferase involved in cell wall biosynthesis